MVNSVREREFHPDRRVNQVRERQNAGVDVMSLDDSLLTELIMQNSVYGYSKIMFAAYE